MPRIDDDDDNIVRDGETVSVRVNLTDTVRFDADGRERFVRMADEAVRETDTTDASTIDAADYRPGFKYATDAARAGVRDARQEMIDRACDAWRRTPTCTTRDAPQPDLGMRPGEAMNRHLFGAPGLSAASVPDADPGMTMRGHMGELFERSQRQRDRAWGSYKDQLSSAWRGRTDPRRAAQEESRLERWKAPSE
jgi:hypothetical protein